MFYQLDKLAGKKLSPNFNQHEADCKCRYSDCDYTMVHSTVLEALEELRRSCGSDPIYITSFFRCQRHNDDVGGVPHSRHKRGLAVDVRRPHHMSLEDFYVKCSQAGFTFCLAYEDEDFVHCQVNLKKINVTDW